MKRFLALLLCLSAVVYSQTRQVPNLGNSANDGTGDSLRTFGQKVANNESNLFKVLFTNSTFTVSRDWTFDFENTYDFDILDADTLTIDAATNNIIGVRQLNLSSSGDLYLSGASNLIVLTPQMSTWDPSSVLLTNRLLTLVDPTNGYWEAVSLDDLRGGAGITESTLTEWSSEKKLASTGLKTRDVARRTQAASSLYFGDSVVAGAVATTPNNAWTRLVSSFYGWGRTNLAFAGAVVTDLNWQSQPGYSHVNAYDSTSYVTPLSTSTNFTVFAKVGINDGADFPTTSPQHAAYLTHYYNSWLHFAAYWATPGKTAATAASESGSWSDWTNHFGGVSGNQSTTPGDTLTFETMGDAVYLGFPVALTNATSFGQFIVSIDGAVVETVDPNNAGFGNRNQWTTPEGYIPYAATNAFWARRYAGYGQRRHTVTITATNNATYPTVIGWAAGSQQPIGQDSGPSVFLLENLNRAANSTRDATYAALRAKVNQVANELGGDRLQVAIVRPNSVYDTATGMDGDGIHPNDTGMAQVALAVRQAVDRFRGLAIQIPDPDSTVTLTAPVTVTSASSGVPAFEAETSGSGFGFLAEGNSFSFIARSATGTPSVFLNKAGGTIASPTAVTSGTTLGQIIAAPYDGAGYDSGALLYPFATENHTASAHGTGWRFSVVPNGSTTAGIALTVGQDSSLNAAYKMTAVSDVSGAGAFEATTSGSGFGFLSSGTQFSFVARVADGTPTLWGNRAGTSLSSPVAVGSGVNTIGIVSAPHDGSTYPVGAGIYAYTTEAQTTNAHGQGWRIYTVPTGSTTQTLAGTWGPDQSLLVAGALGATAITSTTTGVGVTLNGDGGFGVVANRNSNSGGKELAIQRSRAGATAVQSGDVVGRLGFYPHNGTTFPGRRAEVRSQATQTHDGSNQGTSVIVAATANGATSPTDVLTVTGGGIAVTGVASIQPTTTTLTTSSGDVTVNGGSRATYSHYWAADGHADLVFNSVVDGDTGTLLVWAASTNVTLTLTDSFAYSPSGSTLTVTGGTNNWSVVAWEARTINATNVVLVNLGDYSR